MPFRPSYIPPAPLHSLSTIRTVVGSLLCDCKLIDGPGLLKCSVLQPKDASGHSRHRGIVGRQHEGLLHFPTEPLDFPVERLCGSRIQIAGRLIHQYECRLIHQGPRHRHPLFLPSRQRTRSVLGPVGKSQKIEQFDGARTHVGQRPVLDEGRHGYVFDRRKLRKKMVKLKNESDFPISKRRQVVIGLGKKVLALNPNRAAGRSVKRPQKVEERRLPGPALPNDGHDLAHLDLHV